MLQNISRGFSVPIGTRGRFPQQTRSMPENLPLFLALAQKPFSGRHQASAKELMSAMGPEETATLLGQKLTKQNLIWMGSVGFADEAAAIKVDQAPRTVAPHFYAFNWANVSTVKADNWSIQVAGFSKWVFDFEAGNYPSIENDWGRYLRYGAIELWTGTNAFTDEASAWKLTSGWDWSLIPGATTHYLSAEEIAMATPPAKRIMRTFSDKSFCAGLPFKSSSGNFGFELHDLAYPGELSARKSVTVIGDQMICLGSAITSKLSTAPAVTTLFQYGVSSEITPSEKDNLQQLTDPAGNVFKVLVGSLVKRRTGSQSGPSPNGKVSTGFFDTAWIDHGKAPNNEKYAYVLQPRVVERSPDRPEFEILEHTERAHVIRFKQAGLIAYTLFEARKEPCGELLSIDKPCLICTEKKRPEVLSLSICDPDLNYPNSNDPEMISEEVSQPTVINLTLKGDWKIKTNERVKLVVANGETKLSITCCAGIAVELELTKN
jgi:chondroitin-sulfate-ABC endolyase/exolyase